MVVMLMLQDCEYEHLPSTTLMAASRVSTDFLLSFTGLMLLGCGVVTLGLPLASTTQTTDFQSARLGLTRTGKNPAAYHPYVLNPGRVLLSDSSASSPGKV